MTTRNKHSASSAIAGVGGIVGATTATTTETVTSKFLFVEAVAFPYAIFVGYSKDHAISKLHHARTISLHEEVLVAAAIKNHTQTITKLAKQIVNQRPLGMFFEFDDGKKQTSHLKEISHEDAIKIHQKVQVSSFKTCECRSSIDRSR